MTTTPAHNKYVVILCRTIWGTSILQLESLFAIDNAEAIRKATVWRVTAAATIDERPWLQVLLDGTAFHSEEQGGLVPIASRSGPI